jgi:hypothetical protein
MTVVFILLLLISIYLISISPSGFSEIIDDIIGYPYTQNDINFVNTVKAIKNPDKEIKVVNYGCFKDIDEKFFIRKINPFSTIKTFDSAFVISNENDFSRLLDKVKSNGFGNSLQSKYPNINVQDLGILAAFAGYSYVSICKDSPSGIPEIYFSYSPPMTKQIFAPQDYTKYLAKPVSNGPDCGFSCSPGGSEYCGSVNYPNIKSPAMYSVYSVKIN